MRLDAAPCNLRMISILRKKHLISYEIRCFCLEDEVLSVMYMNHACPVANASLQLGEHVPMGNISGLVHHK